MHEVRIDLAKTGGKLTPPGMPINTPKGGEPTTPDTAKDVPFVEPRTRFDGPAADAPPTNKPDHPHDDSTGVCKHCGWNQAIDPIAPTKEDLAAFMTSVRTGELFTKKVSLFGDSIVVTFRSLSAEEEERIRLLVHAAISRKEMTQSLEVVEKFTDFRIALAVKSLMSSGDPYTGPKDDSEVVATLNEDTANQYLRQVRVACKSEPVYRAVRWQYGLFTALLNVIQGRAVDPSFFQATA